MVEDQKVVRDIVFMYVVLHNMLRTHQGEANRAPTLANDILFLQNEQVVCVPYDNNRNPPREAKHQQELLKDYFNHVGALSGQLLRCVNQQPLGRSLHIAILFRFTISSGPEKDVLEAWQ